MLNITKEQVAELNNEITPYVANTVEITDTETYKQAVEFLGDIKTKQKQIKKTKESATKPLNDSLKAIRSWFKPLEDSLEQAERGVKGLILDWDKKVEAEAEKQRASLAEVFGEVDEKDMAGLVETSKTEGVAIRTVKKVVIEDWKQIPERYFEDAGVQEALRKAVNKDALTLHDMGQPMAGVKVVEEKQVAGRAR